MTETGTSRLQGWRVLSVLAINKETGF